MLLVIDIGNTNITMGLYDGNNLINNFRLTTRFQRTSDEYGTFLVSFINASGYEASNYSFASSIIKYLDVKPLFIGPGVKTGISIHIDHPSSLGADRLVDAAGAFYTYGGPCIVIDFGTATTFDVVTSKGEFIGGATSPGIGITANALSSMAAQLPEIEITKPAVVIGKNTVTSMQAGVVFGYIGQTEYIIRKIKEEYGNQEMRVISTGGLGKIIANQTDLIDIYDPDLTFKGLKIIYDKNKNK